MSKVILYFTATSPPSRGAMLACKALGVEFEFKEVDLSKGEHLTPEFLKVQIIHSLLSPYLNKFSIKDQSSTHHSSD